MATSLRKSNVKTTVKINEAKPPKVRILGDALAKMELYIDGCTEEIGWLHAARRVENNEIEIYDSFMFQQEVHATTTEITPEGLSDFATELLQRPDGMELWNDMRGWGHSHVHMATSPSGQDDTQMVKFGQSGYPWMLRLIGNKKNDLRIDLYDYEHGIIFLDVDWYRVPTPEEQDIYDQIEALEYQLAAKEAQVKLFHKPVVDTEIAAKVRKKFQTNYGANRNIYGNTQGTYQTTGAVVQNGKRLEDTSSTKDDELKKNGTTSGTAHVGRSVGMAERASVVVSGSGDPNQIPHNEQGLEWEDFINTNDLIYIGENVKTAYQLDQLLTKHYPDLAKAMVLEDRWKLLAYAQDNYGVYEIVGSNHHQYD